MTKMKKRIEDFKVVENRRLNPTHYILALQAEQDLPQMLPGQFAEVRIDGHSGVFLRRPFSIHDVDYKKRIIFLMVRELGKGSRKLSEITLGEHVNMVYPLGNSFDTSDGIKKPLLIGGGCGIAPLLYLAKVFNKKGIKASIIAGGRSQENLLEVEAYKEVGALVLTTEDGSAGEKGFVTDHSIWEQAKEFDKIYTCGPEPMMKAVAEKAAPLGIPCEVSLENTMACGIGACLCCVVDTHKKGHVCVCTEGPVFNPANLKNWGNINQDTETCKL